MHVNAVAATPHQYSGPAKLAADNDGDGRKGAAALNDGDAAARIANRAIAGTAGAQSGDAVQSVTQAEKSAEKQSAVDVKA